MSNRHDLVLDEDVLLQTALAESRLTDFNDAALLRRVRKVVDAYKGQSLSAEQQVVAAETILDILVTRLRLERDRQVHPEIQREEILNPVVVLGFARSGTTLLYSLLSADPDARSPHWWDALHPSPPPGLSPEHDDLRKQISQREVAEFLRVVPIKPAHNFVVNGADMSLECYVLWGLDFRSMAPFLYFRIPSYPLMVMGGFDDPGKDMLETYRFEKRLLQHLQWRRPTGHWVLKDPTHHFFLPEMNAVFPDATFIWTHRDPAQVFASLVELVAVMSEGMARTRLDRREIAKSVLPAYVAALDRILQHPSIDAPNVIHVLYDEITRNSESVGQRVYARMNRDFTPAVQRRIAEYRSNPNNRSDLYGKFRYSLDNTGYTAAEVREHFRRYIEKFDIPTAD